MCGIAGIVARRRDDLAALATMSAALRHRGPDDEGFLLADSTRARAWAYRGPDSAGGITDPPLPAAAPEGADVGLAHRRLSIIDLSPGGHGPMAGADGRRWVTYNGEVFNYLELRAELIGRGHGFRSASDTEVLLAAWAEWGPAALDRFNGMWAFALYDAGTHEVVCARDRFGVKPFHYFWDGELFAFASEIKGLLAHPRIPARAHLKTAAAFLAGAAVDAGEPTFYEGIQRLPAGHLLRFDLRERRLDVRPWYRLPAPSGQAPVDTARIRELVEDAVRLRLRSDVDVGTCLSGGLDSSAIVALTAALRNGRGRRSFSVVYPDAGMDESRFVEAVRAAAAVEGEVETPTSDELLRDLPAVVAQQDEPFPSAAVYSQWRVMRMARARGTTVLLDGQGADEVLAGYHYHFGPLLAEVAQSRGWASAVREARAAAQVTGRPLPFFLGLLGYHAGAWPQSLRAAMVRRFATHRPLPESMIEPGLAHGGLGEGRHLARRLLHDELRDGILRTSLPALLRYEDRSSMAFAVEARTPYLDFRLVEAAQDIRACDLIQHGWTKAPLRAAMAGVLPEEVRLRRDKLGFATPERRWLREIAPRVREWLGPGCRSAALLRAGALAPWLEGSASSLAERPGLWRLVSVELWLRHLEGRRVA